jgi:hypothetical protein
MSHILVWTWYTIEIIFMLCFLCVVKMIVVSVNIGMHNMRPISALVTCESHNRLYLIIGMFVIV